MNPELKAKWIADLRANPDLQGRMYLRSTDGKFCCIGRLCEVMGVEFDHGRKGYVFTSGEEGFAFVRNSQIPTPLIERFDLSEKEQDILVGKNDASLTFAEIADWIEENL